MVFVLVFIIVCFVLIAFFSGFNLQNACNIWFFGKTFQNVPVFITVLVSFAAGIIITLPAVFLRKQKKLTPEQARAQAERLEREEQKKFERQLKKQQRMQSAGERAFKSRNKKEQETSGQEEKE